VGIQIQLTLFLMIVSPYFAMFARWGKWRLCRKPATYYLTQAEMNKARLGPEFHLSTRYAQLLVAVFVNLLYSAGSSFLHFFSWFLLDFYSICIGLTRRFGVTQPR
jgi:hypothetical protein